MVWAADYLARCHVDADHFVGLIGNPGVCAGAGEKGLWAGAAHPHLPAMLLSLPL